MKDYLNYSKSIPHVELQYYIEGNQHRYSYPVQLILDGSYMITDDEKTDIEVYNVQDAEIWNGSDWEKCKIKSYQGALYIHKETK